MVIEQFLPAFHDHDAVGYSALAFHKYALSCGVESRIVSIDIDSDMEGHAIFYKDYELDPQSIKILHFAIPSPLTPFFLQTGGKKVMIYHNITPSRFFSGLSPHLVHVTEVGRSQLESLNRCFDLSVAVSEYNAGELRELRFANVRSFPLMIDLEQYNGEYSRLFYDQFRDERKNMLFVGRITPNKKVEDLIKVLFFYKKFLSPSIRLIVAGSTTSLPKYFLACRDLASRFHLTSEDIVFTDRLPFPEFLAAYRAADLFVSLSEHEGFCLPLIESCFFQVPILAYAAAAVPETLGEAGVLVREKCPEIVAAAAEEIMNRPELTSILKEKARERIARYRDEARPERLMKMLQDI